MQRRGFYHSQKLIVADRALWLVTAALGQFCSRNVAPVCLTAVLQAQQHYVSHHWLPGSLPQQLCNKVLQFFRICSMNKRGWQPGHSLITFLAEHRHLDLAHLAQLCI